MNVESSQQLYTRELDETRGAERRADDCPTFDRDVLGITPSFPYHSQDTIVWNQTAITKVSLIIMLNST